MCCEDASSRIDRASVEYEGIIATVSDLRNLLDQEKTANHGMKRLRAKDASDRQKMESRLMCLQQELWQTRNELSRRVIGLDSERKTRAIMHTSVPIVSDEAFQDDKSPSVTFDIGIDPLVRPPTHLSSMKAFMAQIKVSATSAATLLVASNQDI